MNRSAPSTSTWPTPSTVSRYLATGHRHASLRTPLMPLARSRSATCSEVSPSSASAASTRSTRIGSGIAVTALGGLNGGIEVDGGVDGDFDRPQVVRASLQGGRAVEGFFDSARHHPQGGRENVRGGLA